MNCLKFLGFRIKKGQEFMSYDANGEIVNPIPTTRQVEYSSVSQSASELPRLNVDRTFFQRIKDRLWGYDFFISYHWASSGVYAINLAKRLRAEGYDVFLDRADYASGDDWKVLGEIALRNTQRLVIIATREAVTLSKPVEREVDLFTARSRQVISIIFGDKFEDLERSKYPTLERMSDSHLYIDEDKETLSVGPSDKIVAELIRTQRVMRRRNVRALLTVIPAIAVIVFASSASISYMNALNSAEKAEIARQTAVGEKNVANTERNKAHQNLAKATRESANALWQLAVSTRDQGKGMLYLKASHLFLQGANALEATPPHLKDSDDTHFQKSLCMAAYATDQSLNQVWRHDYKPRTSIFSEDQSRVIGLHFSRDESRVLTWGDDMTVRLWSVSKADLVQTYEHQAHIKGARFNRNATCVLTWSDDTTARLWDAATGVLLQSFKHDGPVKTAQFSRDESNVLTSSNDIACLWDASNSKLCREFKHDGPVSAVEFNDDGSLVLTSSNDQTAKLWATSTSKLIGVLKHDGPVYRVQFSHDESHAFTLARGNDSKEEVAIWDLAKFERVRSTARDAEIQGVEFGRTTLRFLTWNKDKAAQVWDVLRPDPIQTFIFGDFINDARLNRDESKIVVCHGHTASLLDVKTG